MSVSHNDLAAEQLADPSLSELFSNVDGKSAAKVYLLQEELLRKWVPHGKDFVGNPVFQVVVVRLNSGKKC